ncbi:dihydrofolate reductase family protein [Luteimonas sp. R10]|uniref:dihydrofolate reductase family protein n=1 Tax=Luteimonas sp. R10 TaxID=3108176 RepID=UPI00308E0812|nr:dihydrofolate reductase family protein [Luteimonas sp. R10]
MSKVVCDISISADGYSAGHNQTEEQPFGDGDMSMLHAWMFDTPEENRAELKAITNAKAFVMGRNMFGPIRGEWSGDWKGWWGPEPPYHAPVFVLTHYPRAPVAMAGGTTFHFVTDGIEAAVARARAVPGAGDIAVAGGASTVNQSLAAGLLDELRLHIAPFTLGAGTRVFDGVPPLKLEQVASRATSLVTHVTYRIVKAGLPD